MNNPVKIFLILIWVLLLHNPLMLMGQAGTRLGTLSDRLDILKEAGIPFDQPVTLNFDGPVRDLLAFFSESAQLNLTAAQDVNANVSVSFTNAPAKDIILYLCNAYSLDFRVTGNIIEFVTYTPPPVVIPPKEVDIKYSQLNDLITMNLYNDTLGIVARKVSELTNKSVLVDPAIRNILVTAFVAGSTPENALTQLSASNYLNLKKEDGYFLLQAAKPQQGDAINTVANLNASGAIVSNVTVQRLGADKIAIVASNADMIDIVKAAAQQLNINFYLLPEQNLMGGSRNQQGQNNGNTQYGSGQFAQPFPNAGAANNTSNINLSLQNATFNTLLDYLFKNTTFSYKIQNGVYLIGKSGSETLIENKIFAFQNRSISGVGKLIPLDLLNDVQLDTMPELNSFIISGPVRSADRVIDFFMAIDKLIPVVLIEVIVLDVQTDKLLDLGVEAGISNTSPAVGGSVISSNDSRGGVDFNFSPGAINSVLGLLDGLGFVNIGRVNANFYLSLKAVQQNGLVEVKSTPKLATMNSHTATLSIGQKRYFQEQQVNFPGSDRPIPVQATVFREVEANLELEIRPIVSGDEQVTMEIKFKQSEFIGQTPLNAPPPQVKREFESMIRVRNGEMIVLGGLEREAKSKTTRGVPFLSRIPVIGWMFGRKQKSQSKGKLMIFVKPTIIN